MTLTVVTGPPCAGKTTHVEQHRAPDSVVLDLDALAHALGYPHDHIDWADEDHPAVQAARRAWDHLAGLACTHHADVEVWVIKAQLERWQRAKFRDAGATFVHLGDVPVVTLQRRAAAAGRPASTHVAIAAWAQSFETSAFSPKVTSGSPPRSSDKTGRP